LVSGGEEKLRVKDMRERAGCAMRI
jgi:hypothetical protein